MKSSGKLNFRSSSPVQARSVIVDEKKYKKALRFIYKFGRETDKLTDEAIEVCKR